MTKNAVRMLGFKSDKAIVLKKMYKYRADYILPNLDSNRVACLNSITYGLKKSEPDNFITNNGEYIFALRELFENEKICKIENQDTKVKLVMVNFDEIPLTERKVYEDYIENLCKRNILMNNKNFEKFDYDIGMKIRVRISGVACYRLYKLKVKLLENGFFLLFVNLYTKFTSSQTVLDMALSGRKILGRTVRYKGFYLSKPFLGKLTDAEDRNTPDEFKTVEGLENYYKTKYPRYVFHHKQNDFVTHLKTNEGKIINFLASMLSPVWTLEEIKKLGEDCSAEARKAATLKVGRRFNEARIIPYNIGIIEDIGKVGFEKTAAGNYKFITPKDALYKEVEFEQPNLIVGNGKIIKADTKEKRWVFNDNLGFYKLPAINGKIKIALIATNVDTKKEHFENLAENIFKRGLYRLIPKEKIETSFLKLIDLDYNLFAEKLKNILKPHIAFVVLSKEYIERDADTFEEVYPALKAAFANYQIPSQMISRKQALSIYKNGDDAKHIIENVNFGIMGKLGAAPYALNDNIGDVDIYMGLDVGKGGKGIHYPALGTAFMGDGAFIGGFCSRVAISGEKIPYKNLGEMFAKVINEFYNRRGKLPEKIVIHRDGFAREDMAWYDKFFNAQNIKYSLVEVIKSGAPRLIFSEEDDVLNGINAPEGTALFNCDECIVVTTTPYGGTSYPIVVKLKGGNLNITLLDAARQVYNLSKINAASVHNTRLPITTKYADIISKHPAYIPNDNLTSALYWI